MKWTRYGFVLLVPLIPLAQARADRGLGAYRSQQEVLYFGSGEEVKRLVPGFEDVVADLYWLRTVQYYGGQRAFATEKRFELLRPLIDITTTLDPRLELAYRYGALFLSEGWPAGAGEPRQGVEVLEKGIRQNPASWRLRWDLGSIWYFFLKDERKAADVLIEASRVPGAPYWLESLAGSILVKSHRDVAREIWKRQYEQGDGPMRDNALYHLQLLDALDARDALNKLVERFVERRGQPPSSLRDLVSAGLLKEVPKDPLGVAFDYDPAAAQVSISRSSPLWRSKYES
jgi:hypothetical protein